MQYEPIKDLLGKFFSGPLFLRKFLYTCLDLILLRTWHIKKALGRLKNKLPADATVLDAGSGLGQYSWRMCRLNKNWKIRGVDINESQVSDCNTFFRRAGMSARVSFSQADLALYIEPDTYNFILCVDVMEHIKEDDAVFSNFYKSLKNDGLLLISTPSDKGGSDVHDDTKSFIDEHVRNGYGIEEIKNKLARAGFRETETKYTYGKPGNISWLLTMKLPVRMLNVSYFFFILLPFYYLVFFPVSMIFSFFDLCLRHKTGTGLLVIARK
ncbi:MAG: class I SAM-dependent methyltransferase [Bacteroidales bacterium]|jgi:SAM-dependent methyltransferase